MPLYIVTVGDPDDIYPFFKVVDATNDRAAYDIVCDEDPQAPDGDICVLGTVDEIANRCVDWKNQHKPDFDEEMG